MIIIDRFEMRFAILETDDGMVSVPREQLPPEAKEGDILIPKQPWLRDRQPAQPKQRREKMIARNQKLWKK